METVNMLCVRFKMRDFVKKHNQLQHCRGISYRVKYDNWHGYGIEISISRDIMAEAGWHIGTMIDFEWDKCRIYLIKKDDGMYKVRFSHTSYECHPQKKIPGRFVGCIRCVWKPEFKLPKINPRVFCSDIRISKTLISLAMPRCKCQ
jgi:hypothetical protein